MSRIAKHRTPDNQAPDKTRRLWAIVVLLLFSVASQGCQWLQNEFFIY